MWAIDNALTFHAEYKLRTVIWDFVDEPVPSDLLADLQELQGALAEGSSLDQALSHLLNEEELAAFHRRLSWLIESGRFPKPGPGHAVPWPLV
jgi:hypothetical protein